MIEIKCLVFFILLYFCAVHDKDNIKLSVIFISPIPRRYLYTVYCVGRYNVYMSYK